MQFSSRLPIAVHTLLLTEKFKGQCKITSEFIASSVGVNPVIIRKILSQLKSAGLIEVAAGVGGAALIKPIDEITLLDVFNAVEANEDLFHIHENPNPNCPVGLNIQKILDNTFNNIKSAMLEQMRSIKLSSLMM